MKLKELRKRRVLTTEELAERADVGRNTIYRLEHGKAGAQPRTIRKLAAALGVEPEDLIELEGADGLRQYSIPACLPTSRPARASPWPSRLTH